MSNYKTDLQTMKTKDFKSLPDLFFQRAHQCISIIAAYTKPKESRKEKNQFYAVSWQELSLEVCKVSAALIKENVEKGDRVAILSNTRIDWTISDVAIMSCGAVTTTLYHTCTPEEVKDLLCNSGAKILFVEDKKQFDKVLKVYKETSLEKIILFEQFDYPENEIDIPVIQLNEFKNAGEVALKETPNIVESRYKALEQNDIATIVYTSGTSGKLKGVVLTHRNILAQLEAIPSAVPIKDNHKHALLAFLTTAHIFQRIAGQWYFLSQACPIYYCTRIELAGQYLKEAPVTIILSVPLILEKIKNKVTRQIDDLPDTPKAIISGALSMAIALKKTELNAKSNTLKLIARGSHKLLYEAVLKKIKTQISPTLKAIISGGAPISKECIEFFHAIGIYLIEGYGLTETSAILCANSVEKVKCGSVGKPLKGVDIKISDDDEILAGGDIIFSRYWNNEEDTAEAFSEDGYFKTGDLGKIDEEGNLFIIGRKKDLIVTAGGKKIAPTHIEDKLCSSPYIEQAAVFGDKQKWLCSLITLHKDVVVETLKGPGKRLQPQEWESFIQSSELQNFIEKEVSRTCENLAEYEKIRKFQILPDSFNQSRDELTHTMKIKRKTIQKNYQHLIDSLYK